MTQVPNISPHVVIMTRRELDEIKAAEFHRGVQRGEFEAADRTSQKSTMGMRLTPRILNAIAEALDFRMAGELGDDAVPADDYQSARNWASDQMRKRP
jgi:hypothetical protein